jgi:hypothetical protein
VAGGSVDSSAPATVSARRLVGWVALGVVGAVLFTVSLAVRLSCAVGHCPTKSTRQLFALDGIGGLPRLFITALFVVVAVVAARRALHMRSPTRWWWGTVAVGAVVLAAAKAVSVHSSAEHADGRWVTLVGGLLLTVLGLPTLWWAGRRWSVADAGVVTAMLAVYAAAALGLDQVTGLVRGLGGGAVGLALATGVEEGGEAMAALLLLAAVARLLPPSRST